MPGQHESRLRKLEAIVVGAALLLPLVGFIIARVFGLDAEAAGLNINDGGRCPMTLTMRTAIRCRLEGLLESR